MILKIENARICYEEILKKAKQYQGLILIFTSFDIDSICTLRILSALLKPQNVRYEFIPVSNYDQLDQKIEEKKLVENIASIILINCGGSKDLTKYWFANPDSDFYCLLIDARRPLHYNNINSSNIIIVDDTYYNLDNCPNEEGKLITIISIIVTLIVTINCVLGRAYHIYTSL